MHTNMLPLRNTVKVLVSRVSECEVSSSPSLPSEALVKKKNWEQTLNNSIRKILDFLEYYGISSVQFSCSVVSDCDPMNRSTPGLPVHHQLPEFTQTHIHLVGDASQPSHPLSYPSPPAPNPSQHQGLFQWVNFSHEVAKVLEFQLQHQSFQWTPRADLL